MSEQNFGALLLAGGKSSRMGTDKGTMIFRDQPMIVHLIETVKACGIEAITIVTNQPELYDVFGCDLVTDVYVGKGPMAGIHAGLSKSKYENNLVLACDTPLINSLILKSMLSNFHAPATIAEYDGQVHPLIGVYSNKLISELEKNILNDNLKMSDFVKEIKAMLISYTHFTSVDPKDSFLNFNKIDELKPYDF